MRERIEEIFRAADRNPRCNTAYPVFSGEYRRYQSAGDIMEGVTELGYYLHIPFCRHLCGFCEYTRFQAGNKAAEDRYIELLEKQIREFTETHPVRKIYGLDIGGGTPTALDEENLEKVLLLSDSLINGGAGESLPEKAEGFEKSIEISFTTINAAKAEVIGRHGFKRVSAGIQSMNRTLLEEHGRHFNGVQEIRAHMRALYDAGVRKINLDLMYGLPGMTDDMIDGTLEMIRTLAPEQVTVYEMRYNRMKQIPEEITRELLYHQYSLFYERITEMGYHGRFGKNTFTRGEDHGVSSYLWYRMDRGAPYKGFGISAQSMSRKGLSYGSLKNTDLCEIPEMDSIGNSSNYFLPAEEMAAKYVAVAMYNGSFRLDILTEILGRDSREVFAEELRFLLDQGIITVCGEEVMITREGFLHYGAAVALFWSKAQQEKLIPEK